MFWCCDGKGADDDVLLTHELKRKDDEMEMMKLRLQKAEEDAARWKTMAQSTEMSPGSRQSRQSRATSQARPPKDRDSAVNKSYQSDIMDEKSSHVSALVHASGMRDFQAKYDMDSGMELGRGSCGRVCTARNRHTGALFAVKLVNVVDMGSWEELHNEIELQRKLDHPNICKILESFSDKAHSQVYIIMELCTGGSLVSRMKTHRHGYGEAAAASLILKMLSAVLYCHHHGVVHRDIKLDNMIYEDEREDAELKLIDFGFAKKLRPGNERMFDQVPYDSSVDLWALGVVTYMLLSGKRPFHSSGKEEKRRMIIHDPLRFPSEQWGHISREAKDFCSALMQKAPKDRLPASEAVHHPWLKKANHKTTKSGKDAANLLKKGHEVINSLQAYSEADTLHKLALEVIAFSTPPAKLEELRTLFQKMDTDLSGTIDLDEFKRAMELHPEIPQEQVIHMFNTIDISHNGEVDYTEFLAATINSQTGGVSKGSIAAAFNALDADGDGYITKDDLGTTLDGIASEQSVNGYLQQADEHGRVSFELFKTMMTAGMAGKQYKKVEADLIKLSSVRTQSVRT